MSLSIGGGGSPPGVPRWGMESTGLRAASILAVQTVLFVVASGLAWRPGWGFDAAAVGVVFAALEVPLYPGLALAAVIGYLADLFSGQPHGLWMSGAIAAYAALRLFVFRLVRTGGPTVALLAGFAAVVGGLTRAILQGSVGVAPTPGGELAGFALATVVVGFPGYALFCWASDRFRSKDEPRYR